MSASAAAVGALPGSVAPERVSRLQRVHWTLRIAAGLCFIGHGAFGILTKPDWIPFFGLVGIPEDPAYHLMPLVGSMDILLGSLVLWRPRRILLAYMALWATWTALLRPLTGLSVFELLERGGNYGVPLALLVLSWPAPRWREWIRPAALLPSSETALAWARWVLRGAVCALLVGHGGLALAGKALLLEHVQALGPLAALGPPTVTLAWVGGLEIALGFAALLFPHRALLLGIVLWKLATELLYPLTGAPIFEFVERAGSYGAPLALAWMPRARRSRRQGGEHSDV